MKHTRIALLILATLAPLALLSLEAMSPGRPDVKAAAPMFDPETIYAVTTSNQLVSFDSATPGTTSTPVAITGMQAGEIVLGIDFRPATGQLYALGNTARIYTINRVTGAATAVSAGPFATPLNGTEFGFDFNPTVDLIRVVSDLEQNFRVSPVNGAPVGFDANLAYAAGDPNFGQNPDVVGAAYTNNFNGALTTTLYDIDSSLDLLARQGGLGGPPSPNTGQLFTTGSLTVDTSNLVGFDISAGGVAFAALTAGIVSSPTQLAPELAVSSQLYT
ncbi:MAG: DUF4394 domain-containing protein, partial [Blastocatellia bacterium]